MEAYGNVVIITDLAEITAKHPVVQQAIDRIGLWAAETYDQLLFNVLAAATNTYWPNGRTADTQLIGSDRPSFVDLVSLQALLQDQGGRPMYDGSGGKDAPMTGMYTFITPPQVHGAMQTDPDWLN